VNLYLVDLVNLVLTWWNLVHVVVTWWNLVHLVHLVSHLVLTR
jgi:hypothetical protein